MVSIDHLSLDRIVNSNAIEFRGMMEGCIPEVIEECKKVRKKGRNRLATQRLRKKKVDLIDELKKKLSERKREGRELRTRENQLMEVRDGMVRRQDLLIDEILCSQGLNSQTHTMELATFSIVRRVVHSFLQTGDYDLQENSFREGDNAEWLEFCEQEQQE